MYGVAGTIGITGASGNLGRRVLELVLECVGSDPVVAITRSPEKLSDLTAKGVIVRQGDFTDPDSLVSAFQGVGRLYIMSTDDIREGLRPKLHGNAIRAAKQVGAQHLIYSSAVKAQHSPISFLRDHAATEQLVVDSGLAYTFLRNSFYLETVLQTATQALASGVIYSSTNGGAAGLVSREDCARAAAAVLTSGGHEGGVYDITGSYAWTREEIAGEISNVAGRQIAYVPLSDEALLQGMLANGLSANLAEFLISMDRGLRLGALDVVSRAVEQLTGTPPETLPAFLARHREMLMASAK